MGNINLFLEIISGDFHLFPRSFSSDCRFPLYATWVSPSCNRRSVTLAWRVWYFGKIVVCWEIFLIILLILIFISCFRRNIFRKASLCLWFIVWVPILDTIAPRLFFGLSRRAMTLLATAIPSLHSNRYCAVDIDCLVASGTIRLSLASLIWDFN